MKIVILDAKTLGNDIDLNCFRDFGSLKIFEKTSKDEVIARIKDADIIITNKVYIGKEEMQNANKLKLICISATGINNVDIEEAKYRKVTVANVKGYSTESVVQSVFAYILKFYNSLEKYDNDVKNGRWQNSEMFTFFDHPLNELCGKTLGIIGYGTIGKRVAIIAEAFGMKVLIAGRPGVSYEDKTRVNFEKVLKKSDIITIHTPLTEDTIDLIGEKELSLMKNSCILINTARGRIVNEDALYEALKSKKILGAALDVLEEEPPRSGSRLFDLDNIIVTPHIAWATFESRHRLVQGVYKNIQKYLDGKNKEINVY